jgi:hypothetical protein
MKTIWYHGTNHAEKILEEGFSLPSEPGIWGTGIYLTDSLEDALKYGKAVLEVEWDNNNTLQITYELDIPILFPYLSFEEEEGEPLIQQYIASIQKEAVSVRYSDECTNLVVYDPTRLTKIQRKTIPLHLVL